MQKILLFLIAASLMLMLFSCAEETSFLDNQNNAQEKSNSPSRKCTTHEYTQKLLNNPEFRKEYEQRMAAYESVKNRNLAKALCTTPTVIPVAIHYQNVNNPNSTCLTDLAKRQIEILNADFQGKNFDINKWTGNAASSFPSIDFGETCVKFCLADQNHPSGYGLSNGQVAVTVNATQGDQVNKWSGYLNIYVQFGTGALGYAPYGGSGNGDGVVIEATAFGANLNCGSVSPESPYDLGRTTTHEVGHYFLLDHIWGNGCGQDDEVADTPNQDLDYGGCPNIGQSSCGSTDLHMNYMDYTNDACMYMFTKGQANRMENYMNANLRNLMNNAANVCSEASQNGGGDNSGGGGTGDDGGDDVVCVTPSNLSAIASTTSISFDWSNIEGAISYRIGIRRQGSTSWDNRNPTNSQISFNNLSSATIYDYRIRTKCSDGFTPWSSISTVITGEDEIDTSDNCDTPASQNSTNVTNTEADISWSASEGAIKYQLRYRMPGDSWTRINTNATEVKLIGLFANSRYEYKVRTKCDYGWTAYTSKETFTTSNNDSGGDGGNEGSGNGLRVEVTLDDYGSETLWYIVNSNDEIVVEGGPYGDFRVGQVKTKDIDLGNGCYLFVVEDFYGDGMCCDYGRGSAQIINANGNVIAASNGQFGYYDEIGFCLDNGSARLGKRKKDVRSKTLAKKR